MDRRKFLGLVLAGASIGAVGSKLLLPKRTIILPPRGGWPVQGGWYQAWRWDQGTRLSYRNFIQGLGERYTEAMQNGGPAFCSVQNAEWTPNSLLTTDLVHAEYRRKLEDLFAYATEPHDGPLKLDIIV